MEVTMATVQAFSAEQVRALTGLSEHQLRHYDETGFFSPQYVYDDKFGARNRLYSFQDLVSLRTTAILRNEHHVSLQERRKVNDWLKAHHDSPWASMTFWIVDGHVVFEDPMTGHKIGGSPLGHMPLPIDMQRIAQSVRRQVDQWSRRGPDQIGHVSKNRRVVSNAPVLGGTRIPTSAIWAFHEAGYTTAGIIEQYPQLTPEDIQAAIEYEQPRRDSRTA